jgi:hypothetical protein
MRIGIFVNIIPLLVLGIACSSEARVDSLTAGLDFALDIDSRNNKTTEDIGKSTLAKQDDDYNRVITTPSFHFKSDDLKDGIDFKYAPGLKYDLNGNGMDVDHKLDLSIRRLLLKEWQIKVSDLYVNSDDTLQIADATSSSGDTTSGSASGSSGDQISNELGRRRFINNTASLITNYTYLEESLVTLGYTYSVLRNDDTAIADGYEDYDKHDGLFSVSYRLNPEWKTILGGQYIRGLFGGQEPASTSLSSDLVQYVGGMTLESYVFAKNTLSASYEFLGTRYDKTTRNDNDIHQGTLGWKQEVSPRMKFDLGGGPTYLKTETQEAKSGYNAYANINYSLSEHGKFDCGVKKGFSQDNFSGTSNGGLIDSWQVSGGLTYELYKGLSSRLFASYKNEDHLDTGATSTSATSSTQDAILNPYTKKIYESGIKVTYKFWELYTATAGYTFSRQDSDSSQAINFDEHRVYLSLGFQEEFLQW